VPLTSASSMIVTARRAFSPLTMPGFHEKHLATSRPLPEETQAYVATRAQMIEGKRAHGKTVAVSPLFRCAHREQPGGRPADA
jgi:hypothetical protein